MAYKIKICQSYKKEISGFVQELAQGQPTVYSAGWTIWTG